MPRRRQLAPAPAVGPLGATSPAGTSGAPSGTAGPLALWLRLARVGALLLGRGLALRPRTSRRHG